MAASGAALVEKKDVIARRIEKRAMGVLRAAAGAAMQENDGTAAFCPDLLHVDPVPVADIQHAGIEWAECVG
jgi:hypothetical protein